MAESGYWGGENQLRNLCLINREVVDQGLNEAFSRIFGIPVCTVNLAGGFFVCGQNAALEIVKDTLRGRVGQERIFYALPKPNFACLALDDLDKGWD